MNKTKKVLVVVVCILMTATLASAALLQYFGKVTTTMNAQQSIVIGDGETWHNYNDPVERNIGDVVHCTDYCYKLWLWNRACVDAEVLFYDTEEEGINVQHFVFGDTQTVRLLQKEVVWGQSPWQPLPEGAWADVTFGTCGQTFDYEIVYEGLCTETEYALIYYANLPAYWTEGPVTILGSFVADETGKATGFADIPTMPYQEDENAQRPISDEGESYCHQYGAKIWIVPVSALKKGNDVNWGMASSFLFETDLIFYLDCSDMTPEPLKNVYPIFATLILKAESVYCWISCYHIDFNVVPGEYVIETTVDAEPVQQTI